MKSKLKKILILLPRLSGGGAERVMLNIAGYLPYTGVDVVLAVVVLDGEFKDQIPQNIRVVSLDSKRIRYSLFRILKLIKREKPDSFISTLGQFNLLIAMLRPFLGNGIRWIARESNTVSVYNETRKFPWVWNLLYRLLYQRFDLIIAQSFFMKNDLVNNFGIAESKIQVINNPINYSVIQESLRSINNSDSIVHGRYRLIASGRLVYQKGFDTLISALKHLPEYYQLKILGDGPLLNDLKAMSTELGLNSRIEFLGFKQNPYIYMNSSDLFVLTSHFEGLPNVVLESFACGVPVVAIDSPGGTSEIVINGFNGLLVNSRDPKDIAENIIKASSIHFCEMDIKEWVIERFGIEKIVGQYRDAIVGQVK